MAKKPLFFAAMPKWLKKVEDEEVFTALFAIIISASVDGKTRLTEDEIRERLREMHPEWSDDKVSEATQLMIDHNGDK